MKEDTKGIIIMTILLLLILEAFILIEELPLLLLILLVTSLGFISIGVSVSKEDAEDNKYCVIMLHYDKADYAEVIYCPFQVPDEAVYSGSFEKCKKWADGFNDTE